MTEFTCSLNGKTTALTHSWEHCVGSGHAPMALRADWRDQLLRCHLELGFRHVRFHTILSDRMDTLICQNEQFLYSFFNIDSIFDFLLSIGMKPFVELSFMPETLASGTKTVFRYRANVTPPRDYTQWATLIHKLVSHCVERYGIDEVSEWFFEVWNEPNLEAFWTGKLSDYLKLYRYTARAIKTVDRRLQVGGPATAQNAWVKEFLEYCRKHRLAADFVSTHYYPTDAFGKIGADTITQLQHAPPHVMRERAQETRRHARRKPVYYTEWNVSSNPRDPLHDQPFAAAFATNIIMGVQSLVEGYSFWTFTDIFEENYFPSVPFHGGFGLLNLHGIPKPIYRAFELLHGLGRKLLDVKGRHRTVSAWAVRGPEVLQLLLTNHALPRHEISTEVIKLNISHVADRPRRVFVERIDDDHSNPRKAWEAMGEPIYLSAARIHELEAASSLTKESHPFKYRSSNLEIETSLPPHSVALITVELATSAGGGDE